MKIYFLSFISTQKRDTKKMTKNNKKIWSALYLGTKESESICQGTHTKALY